MQSQGLQLVLLVLAHFQDNEWWKITGAFDSFDSKLSNPNRFQDARSQIPE